MDHLSRYGTLGLHGLYGGGLGLGLGGLGIGGLGLGLGGLGLGGLGHGGLGLGGRLGLGLGGIGRGLGPLSLHSGGLGYLNNLALKRQLPYLGGGLGGSLGGAGLSPLGFGLGYGPHAYGYSRRGPYYKK